MHEAATSLKLENDPRPKQDVRKCLPVLWSHMADSQKMSPPTSCKKALTKRPVKASPVTSCELTLKKWQPQPNETKEFPVTSEQQAHQESCLF